MNIRHLIPLVLVSTLAACGGGGGGTAPSSNIPIVANVASATNPYNTPLQTAVAPTPFSPPGSAVLDTTRKLENVATRIDDETTWGLATVPANGIFAINSLLLNFNVNPNDSLYAPTVKIANGCLEMTTYYINYDSGVWFWDWCSAPAGSTGTFGGALNTGTNFNVKSVSAVAMGNYLRNLGNGYPEYAGEIYRDATSNWHGILYNFATKNWDEIYNTTKDTALVDNVPSVSAPGQTGGWDMFEQHYTVGNYCPTFGTISSRSIENMNSATVWANTNLIAFNTVARIDNTPSIQPCLPYPGAGAAAPGYTPVVSASPAPGHFNYNGNSWVATSN